jgi:hypothetical protein
MAYVTNPRDLPISIVEGPEGSFLYGFLRLREKLAPRLEIGM